MSQIGTGKTAIPRYQVGDQVNYKGGRTIITAAVPNDRGGHHYELYGVKGRVYACEIKLIKRAGSVR